MTAFDQLSWNQQQVDLIVGTLLGDGNLSSESLTAGWRYRAAQKTEHLQYLEHKYQILKDYCGTPIKNGDYYDPRTNKIYKRHYFNTFVHTDFKFFGEMFYTWDPILQKYKKDVPVDIHKYLTPAAIAYFYMDDGALKWKGQSNAMRICTESFSEEGVKRLQAAFWCHYKIYVSLTPHKKNGQKVYRLFINEENSSRFRTLVAPHLVHCMRYKVSDGNYGTL
jgi:hypothetical protein